MPHKLRKTRKKRGTRTVGWGRVGQHRMTGQKREKKSRSSKTLMVVCPHVRTRLL